MTTRFFPAAITQASDGGYTIQVVDVPGTISQGETLEETIVNGEEALALALEMYAAEGRDIPSASDLKAAAGKLDAAERRELVTMQMIRGAMSEPAVRINITLPGDLLKRIDTAAGSYGRSGWIANAARKITFRTHSVNPGEVITEIGPGDSAFTAHHRSQKEVEKRPEKACLISVSKGRSEKAGGC